MADSAVVLGSLVLSLAAAEGFLRATHRLEPPANPPRCGYWDPHICEMYQAIEPYGYALRPSWRTEYLYPRESPRRLTVVSNRHGFRDSRELDEPDGRTRILFLGDSFVFGEGVEEEERLTNVLEADHPGWRVDNLGMTGWGPDLMLRALEALGEDLRPDVVVLCFYTHDFRRVHPLYAGIGFPIPRYVLREGRLVTIPYPAPSLWQRFRVLWAISPARRAIDRGMWDVHTAILDRFRELAERQGFVPCLVFLPGRADTENDRERRVWLAGYAERHRVPFTDLTGPLLARPRSELFIPENPHWNPAGHRFAAELLEPLLEAALAGR